VNELFRQLEPIHLARLTMTAVSLSDSDSDSEPRGVNPVSDEPGSAAKPDDQKSSASEPVSVQSEAMSVSQAADCRVEQSAEAKAPCAVVESDGRAALTIEPDAPAPQLEPVSEQTLQQVDGLVPGCWFEVTDAQNNHNRCRLAAVMRSVDKYIFVNRDGMKASECNRYGLAQALDAGRFRLLDDGMLFDRALQAVIGGLRKSRGH